MAEAHTALLIIRAWVEPHPLAPLRAYVRWTTDVSAGLERPRSFADTDAVLQFVRDWLADVEAQARPPAPA